MNQGTSGAAMLYSKSAETSNNSASPPISCSTGPEVNGHFGTDQRMGGAMSTFVDVQIIGSGAEGTVYRARDPKDPSKFVALKKLVIPICSEQGIPCNLIREVAYLRHLSGYQHPNLVRILDIAQGVCKADEVTLFLIFEHIDHDLANYLKLYPSPVLPPHHIKDLLKQLLTAVEFLHSFAIVHRDIKPQNILVSSGGRLKLTDFGLARDFTHGMELTTVVVTLWYRSPEVLLQSYYSTSVDLWSCGCILAELYLKRPLFNGSSEMDQLHKIFSLMGPPKPQDWEPSCPLPYPSVATKYRKVPKGQLRHIIPHMSSNGQNFLHNLLKFNPFERITAAQALNDPYFVSE